MLNKRKIVGAILVMTAITVVATVAATSVVSAAVPRVLLPLGTSQYAVVQFTGLSNTLAVGFVDMPGMVQGLNVPAGKSADVMVLFCGESRTRDATFARAVIPGVGVLVPNTMQLRSQSGVFESRCANFFRPKVVAPAGAALVVKMQWRGLGGLQEMRNRSMIVILNIH